MTAVLVTGATGFVGQRLVARLLSRGDSVSVTSRSKAHAASVFGPNVTVVEWDGVSQDVARTMIKEIDAVVHLAGANVADKRWTKERVAELLESRTVPTQVLARALADAAKERTRVWLSASAVGIYGARTDDKLLDELSEHGTGTLADICERWEAATRQAVDAGLRVALPRIGLVFGLEGGMIQKMITPFRLGVGGPVGDGKQFLSWVHHRDAVEALLFALDTADFAGPFNVTAPNPVTMNAFAEALGRALQRPAIMRVPRFALKLALGEGLAETALTGQRAVPRKLIDAGYKFAFKTLDDALRDIVSSVASS